MRTSRDTLGLRLQLLGAFRVWIGPHLIPDAAWRRRKAAGLIKLLALSPEHRLNREEVLELLWPTLSPDSAGNNLHRTLHIVRHTIEPELPPGGHSRYLGIEGDLLVLCPEAGLDVDVDAFVGAAKAARESRDPARFEEAIDHYTGDLLPGDQYDDWTAVRRDQLRRAYHELLRRLSRLHEEKGEYALAIEVLQCLLDSEPTEEGTHADLMRLYAASGRRQEALRQYTRLTRTLRRELEAEPDIPARRLYEEIRAGAFPPDQDVSVEGRTSVPAVPLPETGPVDAPSPTRGHASEPARDEPFEHVPPNNLPHQRSSFVGR